MTNPFKTKKFENLKSKWYKKLEKSGFVDVEQDENNLKQWESYNFSASRRARYNVHLFSSSSEYFRLTGDFLHSYKFQNDWEKKIWELHCEGFSITQITKEIVRLKMKPNKRSWIGLTVQRLAKEMLTKYGFKPNN